MKDPNQRHGPVTVRPLDEAETMIVSRYLDDVLTEASALITAPGR